MATTDKESSAAGTDNRPPMLEESDFESWKIRIERYIRGKPLGKLIWKSIKNGPTPHPTITVTTGEGEQQTHVTREKTHEEFIEVENNKECADIQATNILSQGIPRHMFNRLNQTETAKEIWENVELLMQGSGLTEQQKKETLFDQYESKYVTIVKNNKEISTVSYVDLYTHLKSYEQHAMKTLSKMNQTSGNANPLAYMAQATHSTSSPSQYVPPPPQYAPAPQQAPQSTNDAMLATMNQIVNLLSGFQKQFPPTNNQLRTSTNPKAQATIQAGQITTENVQRRAPGNKGKHAATRSQGKVVTCYNCHGQGYVARECKEKKRAKDSYHEDAYDSDVDEAPHAAAAFMANLMQTGPSTGQGTMLHGGEQLDSDVDSVIDDHDNTIPDHQYQLNNEVESVPTDVSSIIPGGISVITILDDLRSQLEGHIKTNKEQSFANDSLKAELERYKKSEKLKADNNALEESYLEELVWLRNTNKVIIEILQSYGQPVQTVPMLSKRPTFSIKDLHKSALGHRNPMYLKSAQLCRPTLYLGDVILDHVHTPFRVYDSEETLVQAKVSRTKMLERMKDPLCKVSSKLINYAKLNSLYDTFMPQNQLSSEHVYWLLANEVASYNCNQSKLVTNFVRTRPAKNICSVVLTSDIAVPMSVEPRTNCVKEHSRNLELEAEILKMKQLLVEKEKRCSFIETKYQELELKFQKYKECFENPQLKAQIGNMKEVSADSNLSTLEFQSLETENTQLKEELTTIRIKNDSLRDENVSIKKRYQDLYQSKAESNSNMSSRAAIPEKPKVLVPGLYAMTPKYIPPRKRNNREANTPLPRKETVSLVKKTNVCVNLSTGIKSVTEASKSKSKCETKTHRNLLARSENVKRVDNPLRNLNNRNRVDSSLSVKRTGFTSKFSKKHLTSYKRKDRKLKDISTGSPPNAETKAGNDLVNANDLSVVQIVLYYLDSGCSQYMTGDRLKLINYVEKFIGTVRFRNDQFVTIVGYDYYKFGDTIITRVYYVEGLSHNLFSVRQFCDTVITNTEVLHNHHMELSLSMQRDCINGKKYIMVIVDDYTRFGWVRFLRTKDETPENRTLMETARIMLIFEEAPMFLWAEAVATACYTLNRSLVHTLHEKTYYELLMGKKPEVKYFRLTEGMTSVQPSTRLGPNSIAPGHNSAGPEINNLQSGRIGSGLVTTPTTPSVPPIEKQLSELFQPLFDEDE
ncbi:retrovirus-related pol polyprotein from transposon TNT 1-94 [Tanacetum coccineum]|uniref:Retrovirus-related pol polyprotein from transposon TNT 1-94 n=1 Tax=Tanacetum coccineum TaxID=301880 RepID=A0ABQ5GXJ1_9ASTR